LPYIHNDMTQPINAVYWVHRDRLVPNLYNPNYQHDSAKELLATSIFEDGWTQPIVTTCTATDIEAYLKDVSTEFEIVDGFHRWTISGFPHIYALTDGYVPIVVIIPKDENSKKMATIRHNRARGTHGVEPMSNIISTFVKEGLSMQEICARLGMEKEEVKRLTQRSGIPADEIFEDISWGREWNS